MCCCTILCADRRSAVFVGEDKRLYLFDGSALHPIEGETRSGGFEADGTTVSPDRRFVAVLHESIVEDSREQRDLTPVLIEVATGTRHEGPTVRRAGRDRWHLLWPADRPDLLVAAQLDGPRQAWRLRGTDLVPEEAPRTQIRDANYRLRRWKFGIQYWRGREPTDAQADLRLYCTSWPTVSSIRVERDGVPVAELWHDYGAGLKGWEFSGPGDAAFLSAPGVVVFDAGHWLYVMDVHSRKLALLARGEDPILPTPAFQCTVDAAPKP